MRLDWLRRLRQRQLVPSAEGNGERFAGVAMIRRKGSPNSMQPASIVGPFRWVVRVADVKPEPGRPCNYVLFLSCGHQERRNLLRSYKGRPDGPDRVKCGGCRREAAVSK
jgi:hypothetical protein